MSRFIAGLGVACLAASALSFASGGAIQAASLLQIRLRLPWIPQIAVAASSAPSPAPSPGAKPAHHRSLLGEGPIVVRGDGTYQLGLNRSSRTGLAVSNDNYSSALTFGLERRTERAAVSASMAFGYGAGAVSAGTMIVGYRTPGYGLTYGQLAGPSDTQLQIGGLTRGVGLSVPLRNGDITYLTATAQQNGSVSRVFGVRRDWNAFGGYLAASGYYAAGQHDLSRQTIADVSYRRYGATLSTQSEVAVSSVRGMTGVDPGSHIATAFQADYQAKETFTTLALHYAPAGLATLNSSLDAGFSADLAVRRHTDRFGELDLDVAHSDTRLDSDVQHDDRLTFTGGRSWSHLSVQYVAGIERTRIAGSSTLQRTGAITFSESLNKLGLFETFQDATTADGGADAGQRQLTLGATDPVLGGNATYQFLRGSTTAGGSAGTATAHTLSYRRAVGHKLDVQISEAYETTSNNGIPSAVIDTGLTFVRRLSSVVSVQVQADVFRQTGLGAGRGTAFSASLIGPFGFGQPRAGYGRANPNLPAVIRGLVSYSASSNPFAYNSPSVRGYNNALIVLDGRVSQRTDSNGEFEFRFVSPGSHTIRIDPATIAPGLITDREYQTIVVQGGQTGSVQFNVGNFAGIAGTVFAADANGVKRPLAGIGIAVDGVAAVTTAPDGHYAVGRLNPGPHTVELVEGTIPTTVAFIGDRKKSVAVTTGAAARIDFVATTLGSIRGNVMTASAGGFGALEGLKNVYVVAQPGDHAAITDDDGSFILDNLPPGAYSLAVDPDTIPDGLGVLSGPDASLDLAGGAALSGVVFKLGAAAKEVVYTFSDGRQMPIQLTTDPAIAPPGALVRVVARTRAKDVADLTVESDIFGEHRLQFDQRSGAWVGTVVVPALVKGDYALTVTAHRKAVADAQALVQVDPALPLFTTRLNPREPEAGHTVRVILKTLADVQEGDAMVFEDGYRVVLPKPAGRLFSFDVRLWRKGLPYAATIITKRGATYALVLR